MRARIVPHSADHDQQPHVDGRGRLLGVHVRPGWQLDPGWRTRETDPDRAEFTF
jgi:hypothetical protein